MIRGAGFTTYSTTGWLMGVNAVDTSEVQLRISCLCLQLGAGVQRRILVVEQSRCRDTLTPATRHRLP